MSKIPFAICLVLCSLLVGQSLRLHQQQISHKYVTNPNSLTNLSQA